MEITFSQTTYYSIEVESDNDMKSLAKALGVTPKKLDMIIENDELMDDDRCDLVVKWVNGQTGAWNVADQDNIEDLEVHA
jgi:plasmid maintenance system antidote protein VapI